MLARYSLRAYSRDPRYGSGSRFAWPGRRWAVLHAFASFHSASISSSVALLQRASLRRQRALDIGKAALELGVGAAQRGFRIGADVAGQVDQREQEIAGFVREFVGVAAVQRGLDLVGLLADLAAAPRAGRSSRSRRWRPCAAIPSRASAPAGPALTPDSSDLCAVSSGGRRAARSAFSSALMRSQALLTPAAAILPSLSANTCGCRRIIFRRDRLDHVAEGKGVLLFRHAGVIDHLQQEIAEFLAEVVEIAAR